MLKKLYQQTHSGLDLTNKLSQINQPVLLIYGDSDPITPKEYGEAATELLPSARLVILPQASHLAHLDQKDKFVRVVRNFVEATAD